MMRAHGAWLGMVRTDQCSLWSREGYDWFKTSRDKVEMIRWDLALGMDCDRSLRITTVSGKVLFDVSND